MINFFLLRRLKKNSKGDFLKRFENSLISNPDLEKLGLLIKENILPEYKYLPLTSLEVERSFSLLKNLLTDRRQKLKEENMEFLLFLQINTNLK